MTKAPWCPVTATVEVPAVVGVPEITPVLELIERPAGRLVADQVYAVVMPRPLRDIS